MPSQATQHYPKVEDCGFTQEVLKNFANIKDPQELKEEEIYHYLQSGGISGVNLLALPSSDDKVHLPKSDPSALIVGLAPYDQANLLAIEQEKIETDVYLMKVSALQYTFVGQEQQTEALLFAKGLLAVVPDGNWPKEVQEPMVFSSCDIKTHSFWREKEDRAHFHQDLDDGGKRLTLNGMLIAVDVFFLLRVDRPAY